MVTSPDGGGVMIVGGYADMGIYGVISKTRKILELRAGGSGVVDWQEVDQELENARRSHVVIPVPDSITTCNWFVHSIYELCLKIDLRLVLLLP